MTDERERPILFSGPMVRAILGGQKTQTRRLVTVPWRGNRRALPFAPWWTEEDGHLLAQDEYGDYHPAEDCMRPYGQPGDRLWVRETWAAVHFSAEYSEGFPTGYCDDWHGSKDIPKSNENGYWSIQYAADKHEENFEDRGWHWRPSIFLPRWASRILLDVTGIRIERLQAITVNDIKAEGITPCDPYLTWRDNFARLWDSINGDRWPKRAAAWESNPWVWVISFRRVTP